MLVSKSPHPQPLSQWERGVKHRVSGVRAVLLLLCILSFGLPANAATWLDPSLKWKTLETPHFSIHYYTELEDIAKRFAPIAEEVHKTMSKVLKYRLDMKTQVVLLDTIDYGNGFTTVFPYPSITLYLTDLGSNLNPYKYDDYLYYLFLHEYTHALHLDMAEGGPSIFRIIFGRMMFPNSLEPWFITEGLATHMETRYTNAGRGRDPRWEAMMRMDVLEDNLKSIDQAAVDTVQWPMGHLRYLYGVKFLDYLVDTYGEDRLVALSHVYGDFLFSLGIDGAFVFIYRKNLSMLWEEWLDYLRDKYQKQKASLGKLTEPQLLTSGGYYNLKPKWSKDSGYIYYVQRNADDYPQLRRFDLSSGRSEKFMEGLVFDEQFGFSPDGKQLLFSKADTFKNFYTFKDLYLMDLQTRKITHLTSGLRASDPNFSPDGKRIVFVRNEKGTKSLEIMEVGKPAPIYRGGFQVESGVQYFSPSFSSDGKTIAVAKHTTDGRQKIYLIAVNSGSEEVLNPNDPSSTEANPCFTPDGKYVLFDSDRTRIVNLYAYELTTGKVFQITNVLGGAMMPDVSPDGKQITYVSYSSRGYDVAVMDFAPKEWFEVRSSVTVTKPVSSMGYEVRDEYTNIHDYNPWPSLLPRFWIPYTYYNENGSHTSIYIGSFDPLMQHLYYANLGYDFEGNKPFYTLYYANNQFLPQITLALSDLSVPYDWNGSTYWEKEREEMLLFSFFDNRVFTEYDRQSLAFGLQTVNLTNISSVELLTPQPNLGNLNAFVLAWRYMNARRYARSISPEDGLDVRWKVEVNSLALGSHYAFTNYSASLTNYFRSFLKHQVLASLLKGFYSRGEQLEQSNFTWRYLSLRGYPGTFLKGNKGISFSLEYRFPLWYVERGLLYGYTFLDRVYGDFFYDIGGATFGAVDQMKLKRGIGAEMGFDVSNLWGYLPMALKFGYAKGLDEGGEEKFYISIGL